MATAAEQQQIIELIVGMVGAAPGADILAELEAIIDSGVTIVELADALVANPAYDAIYAPTLTDAEYAAAFIGDLLGTEVSATVLADSVTAFVALLTAGDSRGAAMSGTITALAAAGVDDADFGDAAQALANKVEVATYYSVTLGFSSDDLDTLISVTSSVTSDPASVTAAEAAADDLDPDVLAAVATAVDAAYAELTISATATAAEKAVATALTLTTAEAAIEAGGTQAAIDAAVAELVAANAGAALTGNIEASAAATLAVATFLKTADDGDATTSAAVDTAFDDAFDAYAVVVPDALKADSDSLIAAKYTTATIEAAETTAAATKALAASTTAAADVADEIAAVVAADAAKVVADKAELATTTALTVAEGGYVAGNGAVAINIDYDTGLATDVIVAGATAGTLAAANFVAPAVVTVQGVLTVATADEVDTFTAAAGNYTAGQTVIIDGVTYTSIAATTQAQMATAIRAGVTDAQVTVSGTPSGDYAITGATTDAIYTAVAEGPRTTLEDTGTNAAALADTADGVVAVTGVTETATITFSALALGARMTIGAVEVTAIAAATGAEVAAAFSGIANGVTPTDTALLTFTGTPALWDAGVAAGAVVTFTSTTANNVATDIIIGKAISETNNPGFTDLLAAAQAQLDAFTDQTDADAAVAAADAALATADPTDLAAAVATNTAALTAAEKAEAALAKAKGAFDEANSTKDALDALEKVAAAAAAKVENLQVIDAATESATVEDDVFMTDETDSVIADFLETGDDVIYLGDAYTVNAGALTDGDDAVLEVFFTDKSKTDDTLVITFETEVFGSSSTGDFFTVELTGLTTDDVTVDGALIVGV